MLTEITDTETERTTVTYTFIVSAEGRDDSTARITMRGENGTTCREHTFESAQTTAVVLRNLAEITSVAEIDEMVATANRDSALNLGSDEVDAMLRQLDTRGECILPGGHEGDHTDGVLSWKDEDGYFPDDGDAMTAASWDAATVASWGEVDDAIERIAAMSDDELGNDDTRG